MTATPCFVPMLAVCLLLTLLGCARDPAQTTQDARAGQSDAAAIALAAMIESGVILIPRPIEKIAFSFIQLIAHPQEYAGAEVRLRGFLEMGRIHSFQGGGEGQLRMNEEDHSNVLRVKLGPCRSGQRRDGGSIDVNQALIEVGYRGGDVLIWGFFEPPDKYGAVSGDFGAICGVTKLDAYQRAPIRVAGIDARKRASGL